MTQDTDDWTDIQTAWQSRGDTLAARAYNRQSIDREQTRMMLEAACEAVVALSCAALFAWWTIHADGLERYILIVLAILSLVTLAVTTVLRRRLWRAQADSLTAYRLFLRRRARLGLLFSRLGYLGGPIGLATGLALGWAFDFRAAVGGLSNGSVGLAVMALAAACWWTMRGARKWRLILDQLGPEETDDLRRFTSD